VAEAALVRDRGAEEHQRREPAQVGHEARCAPRWEVMGDFQAQGEIELAVQLQRLREVARDEIVDLKVAAVDVGAVDARRRRSELTGDRGPPAK
jgi:hypothetical protein